MSDNANPNDRRRFIREEALLDRILKMNDKERTDLIKKLNKFDNALRENPDYQVPPKQQRMYERLTDALGRPNYFDD